MKTAEKIKKGLEYLAERDPAKKVELWEKGIAYDWQEDAAGDALAYIQQLEADVSEMRRDRYGVCATCENAGATIPHWISVNERLPEQWHMDDKDRMLINYLVYSPEYGVDIGNYVKPAKRWVCMGLPMNVTHWMPLPEPPEVTKP